MTKKYSLTFKKIDMSYLEMVLNCDLKGKSIIYRFNRKYLSLLATNSLNLGGSQNSLDVILDLQDNDNMVEQY